MVLGFVVHKGPTIEKSRRMRVSNPVLVRIKPNLDTAEL